MQKIDGKIYKITNKINGKVYIGQTIRSLKKRWKEHCSLNHIGCTAISNAINKYGKGSFYVEQIDSATNIDSLNKKERDCIISLNTIAPNGYNLREGGENSGKICSKSRMRMANSQKKLNKKRGSGGHPRAKKVINIETGEIFNSLRDIVKVLNINYSTLRSKLQGKNGNNTPYRYLGEEYRNKEYKGSGANQGREIVCLNSGITYNSIKQASEKLGIKTSTISYSLINDSKILNNYTFKYKDV